MNNAPKPVDDHAIRNAVEILHRGGLVAFPTETVYGLGADAGNPDALKKIFKAKNRPADHPLIVHLGSPLLLSDWASEIPGMAWKLAERFWPGPLTIVLNKLPRVPLAVTGGQQTVAVRIPDNPVALRLLTAFGDGIAAPSANRYNHISPTRGEHVASELGDSVDLILDGGSCRVGLESTIIDLTGARPLLLRPGHITPQQLEEVLQTSVTAPQQTATRAPGMLAVHYAPVTTARLCPGYELQAELYRLIKKNRKIGLLAYSGKWEGGGETVVLSMPDQAEAYGRSLYAALRKLDDMALDIILIEQPPLNEHWLAVNDRLSKATAVGELIG